MSHLSQSGPMAVRVWLGQGGGAGQARPAVLERRRGSIFMVARARRHLVSSWSSKTRVSSVAMESQAFCCISLSSWPGPQPA